MAIRKAAFEELIARPRGPVAFVDVRNRLEWHLADQAEAAKEFAERAKSHSH